MLVDERNEVRDVLSVLRSFYGKSVDFMYT
jgi:hypothetical protein